MEHESIFFSASGSTHSSDYHSDDGEVFVYKIPMHIRQQFSNQAIIPICYEVIGHLTTPDLNFVDHMKLIQGVLKKFIEGLDYEHLYSSVIDFLVWTRTLDRFCRRKRIEKSQIVAIARRLLNLFDEDIGKRDADRIKEVLPQLNLQPSLMEELFEAIFSTKCYNPFLYNFCQPAFFNRFVNFLFRKIEIEPKLVFLWMHNLNIFKYYKDFPVEKVLYYALTKSETGTLLQMAEADKSKRLATLIVNYLDKIVGTFFIGFDPEPVYMNFNDNELELKKREKELVKMALSYYKRFQLDKELIKNCIFVRQMRAFIRDSRENGNTGRESEREIFHQKTIHIMSQGDRIQYAVLCYLYKNSLQTDALVIALKMKIPMEQWPEFMNYSDEKIASEKEILSKSTMKIKIEQATIKDGFNLLKNGINTIRMIDSEESIQKLLEPFIKNPENAYFGMDAEWDMSYCGEMGTMCLIQMSGEKQTLLIDIHTFKEKLKWSEERFLELFKLIFSHEKKIFGFALDSDLKIMENNFPLFATELLPKLNNFICLYNAVKKIRGDINLSDEIFGDNPPEELNLKAMASLFLNLNLDKVEQSSVWSCRPLRRTQQKYAARDSHTVVLLTKKIWEIVEEKCPEKLDFVFDPWAIQPVVDLTIDGSLSLPKKTKCNHFKDSELKDIIKLVNKKLELTSEPKSDDAFYITDTMCDPLGACLRRLGVSVLAGLTEDGIRKKAFEEPTLKILTCGKAVKKYQFGSRVLNINASLSLEHQLTMFLKMEKIRLDPDNIKPRCIKCNGNQMVFIPAICLKYLHYSKAISKAIDIGVEIHDLVKLEEEMDKMNPRQFSKNYCFISDGKLGLMAMTKNALIYLQKNQFQQVNRGRVLAPESYIKIQLAMHLLYQDKEYDDNLLYAICYCCGKENSECSIALE